MLTSSVVALGLATVLPSGDPADAEKLLFAGTREQALRMLEARYAADADDVNAFALAASQLLAAGERAAQSLVKAGVINRFIELEEAEHLAIEERLPGDEA